MTFWPGEWEQTGMDPMVSVENTISWVALLVLGSSGIPEPFVIVGFCRVVPVEAYGNWSDMISCAKRKLGGIVDHAAPAMHFEVSTFATECHSTVLNMQGEYPRKIIGGVPLRLSTGKGIHKSAIPKSMFKETFTGSKILLASSTTSQILMWKSLNSWPSSHLFNVFSHGRWHLRAHLKQGGPRIFQALESQKMSSRCFSNGIQIIFAQLKYVQHFSILFPLYFCSADAGSPS